MARSSPTDRPNTGTASATQPRGADPASPDTAKLLHQVYQELRRLARNQMHAERDNHTLQATALVHEAYLRLAGQRRIAWQNKAHFFSTAAEAMRQILLDHAKARASLKRGGAGRGKPVQAETDSKIAPPRRRRKSLDAVEWASSGNPQDFLSLDEAVCRLTIQAADIGQVVRLRFYAGLSVEETAATLGISTATVKRRWEFARTWLYNELA